jgi:hypothetical protein
MTPARRPPPPEWRTHSWERILEFFRGCARANPYFVPLGQFATRLAASRYAQGLFPVQSMHSVRLYQNDRVTNDDPMVHVVFDHGEFVVTYWPGALRPSRAGTPAVWERRGPDGFGILEGCLRHLGWFVEYRLAEPPSPADPAAAQDA